jgi:hypothetical protein
MHDTKAPSEEEYDWVREVDKVKLAELYHNIIGGK